MKFRFDTRYSEAELKFLQRHSCEVLSEVKLSRAKFSKEETPRRMFRYGGTYIAEIMDEETGDLVRAAVSKWRGVYHVSACYGDLESLEQGL